MEEFYTEEYEEYLERYEFFGEGMPKLSAEDFDRLDDELLELLAQEADRGQLSPEQEKRRRELEHLMLLDKFEDFS